MKKLNLLLGGVLSATLVLGACGNEESKSEDKKETVKADADKQKDKKQKEAREKQAKKDKQEKEKAEQEQQQSQQASTEESQSQEQQTQQVEQQEPTEQEKTEANKEWAKENIKGGTDAGMLDPSVQPDEYYSNDQLDPDTGLPKDDAVPHKVGENVETTEEPSEWVKGQDEWMNASEAEREEIRKADAEKYGYEYDPEDFEE
ncbi:hypothetical protein [Staphylococcus saprophyticus]|uniref:hypothetical protein n=1 Tax=Staphylococcus saprophyticus TaxID=29385 RepID=UPI00119DDF08|nr:hypothetical protein [Staphylococcus saprophyticus]